MYNYGLGSSFGGCYSPKDYTVNNPTFGGNTSTMYASGSKQGGYYYSPARNEQKNFPARDLLNR